MREEIEDDSGIIDVTLTEKKDPSVKKFDPKGHKADQAAPPINQGVSKNASPLDDEPAPPIILEPPSYVSDLLDVPSEIAIEQKEDAITGEVPTPFNTGNPGQELFEKLQAAIKEVETSGNKFRWRNWLKKHMAEVNSLREQGGEYWKTISEYVAFMNNKKWK